MDSKQTKEILDYLKDIAEPIMLKPQAREALQLAFKSIDECEELRKRLRTLQACHDSELGVCYQYCYEVQKLKARQLDEDRLYMGFLWDWRKKYDVGYYTSKMD